MELVIKYEDELETKEIKDINMLKDELCSYYGSFIQEDDEYGIQLFEMRDFDNLIDNIEEYFVYSFFELAKAYFLTLKEILSSNTIEEIKEKIPTLNNIFNSVGLPLEYDIK